MGKEIDALSRSMTTQVDKYHQLKASMQSYMDYIHAELDMELKAKLYEEIDRLNIQIREIDNMSYYELWETVEETEVEIGSKMNGISL